MHISVEKFEEMFSIIEYSATVIFKGPRLPFVTNSLMKILEQDNELSQSVVKVAKLCFKNGLLKTRQDMKGVLSKFDAIASPNLKKQF